jgi:ribosome maturation factor RimP
VFDQYRKFLGKEVEVVLKSGGKQTGVLSKATESEIELTFQKLEKIEGKKKKEKIEVVSSFPLTEIKSTKPFINFK